GAPADPEREGLPRLDRDTPEHLLDTELCLEPPDEVMRADGDAARGDEDVCVEPTHEGVAMRVLVVRSGREHLDLGACGLEKRCEHPPVRLEDLAGLQVVARRPELAPGREHGRARSATTLDLGDPGRAESADVPGP